ncbi:alpha/beta hydrolase [Paraburkholderia sp. DHOC27]|uniref:RBBP9/YdeN family alpha/beta hydrolase n=1 Tax=Paraburkholderia sp. DHOC27 TaxID=2303330 RepID=UPI000E3CF4DF|nr:alpha/beta hydrolase [Paraburkholderia sp. DHOC27]RFU46602.1 serine hydrolase family protein [Paraburkholderia sp. DHOC27]
MLEQQVLILPGYMNSGAGHWQTRWESLHPGFRRVPMPDWDHPVRDAWCRTLDASVRASQRPVLLAAHSLGCLTVAFWAAQYAAPETLRNVTGALLVALPDPDGPGFPPDASGSESVPMVALPFASIVVASTDDPYGGVAFAQRCAKAWGSQWHEIGARGHINADSGLGDWDEGQRWLASLGQPPLK